MKTKILGLAMWASVLFFSACSGGGEKYLHVIPQDALMVASFDVKELASKGGFTDEDSKAMVKTLKKSVTENVSEEELEMLTKLVENPAESGLDLEQKVYLFSGQDSRFKSILAAVKDYGKLKEMSDVLLAKDGKSFSEVDGCRYIVDDERMIYIYNESALLMLTSEFRSSEETLRDMALEWMKNNDQAASFVSTEEYEKMTKADGDITFAFSLNVLPEEQRNLYSLGIPKNVDLKDIAGVCAFHFEKGKLQLDIESIYKSEQAKAQAEKMAKIYSDKLEGKFLNKFPENSALYMAFSCDGDELYKVLMDNEMFKSQFKPSKLPFDLKSVLESFDGEIAMAMAEGSTMPQLGLYAEVENDELVKALDDYKSMLGMAQVRYGVEDDIFYLTNMQDLSSGNTLKNAEWKGLASGQLAYINIDMKTLADLVRLTAGKSQARQVQMVAEYLKSFTIYSDDVTRAHIVFTAADADTNVLKQLVDLLKQMN